MSESQWNYLGLSHNPFSDPQQEFFSGAGREALLSKVRNLDEWSRPIIAVSGPHGVGKTCLFRALSSSLEPGVVAARVNGSLVSRAGDVLSALVQGYGVSAPAGADAPLLIEMVISHLKDQAGKGRTSLVLVDDAHLLEQRAVDDLVNLAESGAKIAFFSEPQFVEPLQRAVERNAEAAGSELAWEELLLSPFSREQSGDYLEWRFAEAGYNGRMPFTEHQVDGIYRASEGYPGQLDFSANERIISMTVGGSGSSGIPRKHLWLSGGLAAALVLTLWFWSPGQETQVDSKTVELEVPKPDPDATSTPAEDLSKSLADSAEQTPTSTIDDTEPSPTLSRTVQPVPSAARPVPEPVPSTSRTVRPEPSVTKPPVAEVTREAVETPVRRREVVKVEPPKPQPQPQPVETAAQTSSTGPQGVSWLLAQDDSFYTIQLVALSDADRASAYVAEQERPERFALYRSKSRDRIVHVVTYGLYATQEAATAASENLPAATGKITPWVRSMRIVKGAIIQQLN